MQQIKIKNKLMIICLLACFLLLTSYISVFDPHGLVFSDHNGSDVSPANKVSGHSSMAGDINIGLHDYIAAANMITGFSISSLKQSHWPGTKMAFDILMAIVSGQMACFIFHYRPSDRIDTTLISTVVLHKKDGKK